MYKATQRVRTLLLACFTVLFSVFFAVALWVTPTNHYQANAAETTYSYTFIEKQFSANGMKTLNDVDWTLAGDGGYWGYDGTKGQQFGSSGAPYESLTFTSASFDNVSKITINTSGAKSISASFLVYVGDTKVGDSTKLTSTATEYNFAVNSISGAVKFEYTQSTSASQKAIYIKSISIEYGASSESTCTHTNTSEEITKEATCTEAGIKTIICDDCGETVSTEEIPTIPHNYVGGACSVCGETQPTEETETLSIRGTTGTLASDSASISWTGANIIFKNEKGSTAIRTSDSDHYRVYAGSKTTISTANGANIKTVVITCTSNSYATVCNTDASNGGYKASVSGNSVTITFSDSESIPFITFTASAQWRLNAVTVTYVGSNTPACEHANTTTTTVDATCTNAGSITVTCDDCGATVSTEETPATGHINTTTTTEDATCTENGSITVTCDDCHETVSTETIDALGHDFDEPSYESNSDGTHDTTGTCLTCGESTTETEDCNYERTENEISCTYTCSACEYTYSVNKYTITYNVPTGVSAIENAKVEANKTINLEAAGTVDGYTFIGWTTSEYDVNSNSPTKVYKEGQEYTVQEDITFYALYTLGEIVWELVTDASDLQVGQEIVIVASESDIALSTTQNNNNRGQASITKNNDIVTFGDDVQIITLEEGTVDNTFAFNVGDGYLYAASSSSNHLKTQDKNNDNGSWTISITENNIAEITAQGANTRNSLKYNKTSSLFSCYDSDNTQKDVSIYMKSGEIYYTTSFLSATINSASITLHDELAINYKITMSESFAGAKMYFTVNGETVDVDGEVVDEKYVFSLNLPPQYMATNIEAQLKLGDIVLAEKAEYSVKTYAQNKLNDSPSDKLKQLLTDLLYYGDAAYNYELEKRTGNTTDKPVTGDVENLGTPSTAEPDSTNFTLVKNEEIDSYPAYFTAAGVRFEGVNKLYVKISTTENVTLTINGGPVEVTDTTIYTDGILATDFDEPYTFVLSCNGVVMQTLTYSVNAYAYAMKGEGTMGILALALYRYGKSAEDYNKA